MNEQEMRAKALKGKMLLLNGDYENGWPLYRYNTLHHEFNAGTPMEMWDGNSIDIVCMWQDEGFW